MHCVRLSIIVERQLDGMNVEHVISVFAYERPIL